MVRKKEEKKTREGDAMDVIPSHPCVVALANQRGARDRQQDGLSIPAIPIGARGGTRLIQSCISWLLFVQLSCSDASELMPVKAKLMLAPGGSGRSNKRTESGRESG